MRTSLLCFAVALTAAGAIKPAFWALMLIPQALCETKVKLGSAVPPADFVLGCDKVCAGAKSIKDYWKTGDAAEFACGVVADYGCAWTGTPPLQAADIGC